MSMYNAGTYIYIYMLYLKWYRRKQSLSSPIPMLRYIAFTNYTKGKTLSNWHIHLLFYTYFDTKCSFIVFKIKKRREILKLLFFLPQY